MDLSEKHNRKLAIEARCREIERELDEIRKAPAGCPGDPRVAESALTGELRTLRRELERL